MHKIRASMPPKHVKPTQLRCHGLQLLEIIVFWVLHDYQTGLKGVAKVALAQFAAFSQPRLKSGVAFHHPILPAEHAFEFPPPPIETWAASARPNNQEFQMNITTLIKFVGGLLIVGGISLAIHEMNGMMDSMIPAAQGVVLAPIAR